MRRLAPLLALLALVGAVAAPAAQAGEGGKQIQVLGPTGAGEPGPRLYASFGDEDRLCLDISEYEPDEFGGNSCSGDGTDVAGDPFAADRFAPASTAPDEPEARRIAAIGGAVSADVAVVEYVVPGGRRIRAETVPAPPQLAGTPGAELRWFLVATPAEPYTRRLLDAAGVLLAEEDEPGFDEARPPVRGPVRLLSGRNPGGGSWSLSATVERPLLPVRGNPGRRERTACVALSEFRGTRENGESTRAGSTCEIAGFEMPLGVHEACGATGQSVVYGLLPADAATPVGVLGDGRRVRAQTRVLPAAFATNRRAWAVPVPPGVALRSVTIQGELVRFDLQPSTLIRCGIFGAWLTRVEGGPLLGGDVSVALPDGPPLSVRDRGDQLCVAVERPTRVGDCQLPDPSIASMLTSTDDAGTRFGAAVDARVKTIRVRLTDGQTVMVPTSPAAPAYTGRYAAHVAFASYAAPAGTRIADVSPLDLRGRPARAYPIAEPRLGSPTRTLLRGRGPGGPFRITATPWEPLRSLGRLGPCVHLSSGPADTPARDCRELTSPEVGTLTGVVDCRARAALLTTGVSARARSVTVHLSDGSVRRARIHRVGGRRVAIAVPPARLGVRRVVVRGAGGNALQAYAAPVPPAVRQCGYDVFVWSPSDSLG